MKNIFKLIGICLIAGGFVILIISIFNPQNELQQITLPGNIKGFSDGSLKALSNVSEQELSNAFIKAQTAMDENVAAFKWWDRISTIGSWLAFFLGGIITLLAGYLGYAKGDAPVEAVLAAVKNKVKLSRTVGIIAAIATLSTGLSVKAKEESEFKRRKGIEIRDLIIASYKDLQSAKPEEVKIIIEKLQLQSSF